MPAYIYLIYYCTSLMALSVAIIALMYNSKVSRGIIRLLGRSTNIYYAINSLSKVRDKRERIRVMNDIDFSVMSH